MRLKTPNKLRNLQKKLYYKAKAEPDYRFYLLYDKVYRQDILKHAYLVNKNKGRIPGIDGETFKMIGTRGLEQWLSEIKEKLRAKTYSPYPVKKVKLRKFDGKAPAFFIHAIRDRVVQTALRFIIEPILEAEMENNIFCSQSHRSALNIERKVHGRGYNNQGSFNESFFSKYFYLIPPKELIKCVSHRIVDRKILHLISSCLEAPVIEYDKNGKRQIRRVPHNNFGMPFFNFPAFEKRFYSNPESGGNFR